jgi:hypothetical protein
MDHCPHPRAPAAVQNGRSMPGGYVDRPGDLGRCRNSGLRGATLSFASRADGKMANAAARVVIASRDWHYWPTLLSSQPTPRRIGALMVFAADDPEGQVRVRVFEQGMRDLGWEQGRNIAVEYRWAAGDLNRVRVFAQELVGLGPDVIVVVGTPAVVALRQETDTIPIVFVGVTDPIASELTRSLAHPSDNFTGLTNFEPSITGKWLELLKEAEPKVTRFALMFNPKMAPGTSTSKPFFLGLHLRRLLTRSPSKQSQHLFTMMSRSKAPWRARPKSRRRPYTISRHVHDSPAATDRCTSGPARRSRNLSISVLRH